ncbi:MAG: methionyl-tRNA formyltransferase, partial [Clostridiales bacterium]|nr:methionyl-tRNA formyltransferase [Clostridiales bacterium]
MIKRGFSNMKAVFMGTPEIAASILRALLENNVEIIGVVTQPDKPKGRGKEMAMSDVKKVALEYNLPIYQPVRARNEDFIEEMRSLNADMFIVVAFGQILSQELLDIPPMGCINVHASLLPKFRGAAPIQQVIIDGEEKTGVTIMKMDAGIDTGDMIYKEEIAIAPDETGGSLHDKLLSVGAHALLVALKQIQDGTAVYEKQDPSQASYFGQFKKEAGLLDFNKDAVVLERLVRGLNPWPSAYTKLHEKTLKIWKAEVVSTIENVHREEYVNGSIVAVNKDSFSVKTGKGYLKV